MLQNFKAYRLARDVYQFSKSLRVPKFLHEQLLRASSSVVLNIAEGSGKRTAHDQARFYSIALGSLRECQAIFDMETIRDPKLASTIDQLGAILYRLSNFKLNAETKAEAAADTETETETGN